ncbi:hypothetical protein CDAR_312771 [Caerostris darwini]|uniref:Uncharacterized protein n=1 Tax=Caerostris darwini TaxID=1538125 RepID=A0AAV4SZ27_9ARAC|nr:hypothetical protein CDAR_312771 [Caerostris darwini]
MSVDEQILIQRGDAELDKTISIFKKRKFERHKDWDLRMKELDRNLNKASNKNPFQMLHGYSPRFNNGILGKQADESSEGWTDPAEIQTSSHERIENMQKKMKDAYNKKKCVTTTYKSGQAVVMKNDFVTDR